MSNKQMGIMVVHFTIIIKTIDASNCFDQPVSVYGKPLPTQQLENSAIKRF